MAICREFARAESEFNNLAAAWWNLLSARQPSFGRYSRIITKAHLVGENPMVTFNNSPRSHRSDKQPSSQFNVEKPVDMEYQSTPSQPLSPHQCCVNVIYAPGGKSFIPGERD